MNEDWKKHTGDRLLLTDRITGISRDEYTLMEISPNGKVGKFRNEEGGNMFWTDLDELRIVDVLTKHI